MYIYRNHEHTVVVSCQLLSAQCFFKLYWSQSDYGHKKRTQAGFGYDFDGFSEIQTDKCSTLFPLQIILQIIFTNKESNATSAAEE